MNNYVLQIINPDEILLLCLGYNSILNYVNEIEKESVISSKEGTLIVDQLLVAGNGKNRFISCHFSYGNLELATAKNVDSSIQYKEISTKLLQSHYSLLKYSILSEKQLDLIREGQLI